MLFEVSISIKTPSTLLAEALRSVGGEVLNSELISFIEWGASRIAVPLIVREACGISLVGVSSCLAESETDSRLILVAVA